MQMKSYSKLSRSL